MSEVNFARLAARGVAMPEVTAADMLFETKHRLGELAFPRGNETKETGMFRAAREVGMSARQVRRILKEERKTVEAHEYLNVLLVWREFKEDTRDRAAAALNQSQALVDAWQQGLEHGDAAQGTFDFGRGAGLAGEKHR